MHNDTPSGADYRVTGGGTIYLVRPLTILAAEHLRDRVSADAQWHGHALAVEHRYIDGLVCALHDDGFAIEDGRGPAQPSECPAKHWRGMQCQLNEGHGGQHYAHLGTSYVNWGDEL